MYSFGVVLGASSSSFTKTRNVLLSRLKDDCLGGDKFSTLPNGSYHPSCDFCFVCAQIEFGERWPVYGFERHKGYGTSAHRDAIREHGMVEIHRRSFLKKMEASGGKLTEYKG